MKKPILLLLILVALAFSCKSPIWNSTLKNTKWRTELAAEYSGYIEEIIFNKDKTFQFDRYIDDMLFESIKGTYTVFSAILGGCEHATIKFVSEEGKTSLLEFYIDPSGKSLKFMGHVDTLYYLVEDVPEGDNQESSEVQNESETSSEENQGE